MVIQKREVIKIFHRYDSIHGIHRKLHYYIIDNGKWKLNYFVAYLSHNIYKAQGIRGHRGRGEIRNSLKVLAKKMFVQVYKKHKVVRDES